jgi:TRAP-type C4-dicarboxylate transport system permease small subunit
MTDQTSTAAGPARPGDAPGDGDDAPVELAVPRAVRHFSSLFVVLASAVILAVMAATAYDVTRRKLGEPGVSGIIELTEVALVFIALGGLVVAEVDHLHVRSPLLTDRLPPRAAHALIAIGLLVSAAVVFWATREMAVAAQRSFEIREYRFGLAHVPIWPAKVFAPLALGAFGVALVAKLVVHLRAGLRSDPPPPASTSEEGAVAL